MINYNTIFFLLIQAVNNCQTHQYTNTHCQDQFSKFCSKELNNDYLIAISVMDHVPHVLYGLERNCCSLTNYIFITLFFLWIIVPLYVGSFVDVQDSITSILDSLLSVPFSRRAEELGKRFTLKALRSFDPRNMVIRLVRQQQLTTEG